MGKNVVHFAMSFLFDKISKKVYIYGSDEQLRNKKERGLAWLKRLRRVRVRAKVKLLFITSLTKFL